MLKDLTMIIPTHDRHQYLDRVLVYYSGLEIKVVVVDSSPERYVNCDLFPNVTYFHFPNLGLVEKCERVVEELKTDHVIMCADDDYSIPESIRKMLLFLKENDDYSAALGAYVCYHKFSKGTVQAPIYLSSLDIDVNDVTAVERLSKFFLPAPIFLFYSVQKTENLKDLFKLLDKYELKEFPGIWSLLVQIIPAINGKVRVLPKFFSAREWDYRSAGYNFQYIEEIVRNEKTRFAYYKLIDLLSDYVSQKDGVNFEEAKGFVEKLFDGYFNSTASVRESALLTKKEKKVDDIEVLHSSLPEIFPDNNNEAKLEWKKIEKSIDEFSSIYKDGLKCGSEELQQNSLREIGKIGKDLSICIYGAGIPGVILKRFVEKFRPDLKILCFIDDYKKGEFDALPVFNMDQLNSKNYDLILIAPTKFQKNMENRLKSLNNDRYISITPDFDY